MRYTILAATLLALTVLPAAAQEATLTFDPLPSDLVPVPVPR